MSDVSYFGMSYEDIEWTCEPVTGEHGDYVGIFAGPYGKVGGVATIDEAEAFIRSDDRIDLLWHIDDMREIPLRGINPNKIGSAGGGWCSCGCEEYLTVAWIDDLDNGLDNGDNYMEYFHSEIEFSAFVYVVTQES